MEMGNNINYIKEHSCKVFEKYPFIKKAYLFGSHARGNATAKSDVDFFVEVSGDVGLCFFGLYDELYDEFNVIVDILTDREVDELISINPDSSIRKDAILLYER